MSTFTAQIRQRWINIEPGHLLAFAMGMTALIEFQGAGRLMGADFICLGGLAYVLTRRQPLRLSRYIRIAIMLAAIWLMGAMLTDMFRATPSDDIVRGWSKIIILLSALIFLGSMAARDPYWVIAFAMGISVQSAIKPYILEQWGFDSAPWKFGYGPAITFCVMVAISNRKAKSILGNSGQAAICAALGVANLIGDYRSYFAFLILIAALLALQGPLQKMLVRGRVRWTAILTLAIGALVIVQGISLLYESALSSGMLSQAATDKYRDQEYTGLGVLQSGRTESLVSIKAIADSPILGHGSWAKDITYQLLLQDMLERRGLQFSQADDTDLIPSHSSLLGSWVEAGILSVGFWCFVLFLCARCVALSVTPHAPMRPLLLFMSVALAWDTLFSPFGAQQRFSVAASVIAITAFAEQFARMHAKRMMKATHTSPGEPPVAVGA